MANKSRFVWTNDKNMLGFYFSSEKTKKPDFSTILKYCDINDVVEISAGTLYLFSHASYPKLKKYGDDFIFNVGMFIYKDEMNEKANRIFMDDLLKGADIKSLLAETKGQFCLVVYMNGRLHIATDKAGIFPVYGYEKNGKCDVSNFFAELASCGNDLSVDYAGLMHYLLKGGGAFFLRTCFNEISLLSGGHTYSPENGKLEQVEYFNLFKNLKPNKYRAFKDVLSNADKIFEENLAFLKNQTDIYLDLSGGFDTRTLLSYLLKGGYDFSTGSCVIKGIFHPQIGSGVYDEAFLDLKISKKIAETFNFERKFIYIDNEHDISVPEAYEFVHDLMPVYNITTARTFAHVLQYHQGKHGNVSIAGLGGTETLNKRGIPKTMKGKGFDIKKFPKFSYKNVLKDGLLSVDDYYRFFQSDMDSKLKGVDYENLYDLEMFASLHWKYRQGGVSAAYFNYYIPSYVPYLEANFLRFLSECKYEEKLGLKIQRNLLFKNNKKLSNMESTHGYPPTKITPLNFHKFFKFFREHPDYLPSVLSKIVKKMNDSGAKKMRASLMLHEWASVLDKKLDEDLEIYKIFDKQKIDAHLKNLLPYERYAFIGQMVALDQLFNKACVKY